MGFPQEYLVSLAECWRWKPEKMAERRKLWPETLTWGWFLDPLRVAHWDRREQLEILSVATLHAHKVRAPVWAKPAEIYREAKALALEAATAAEAGDAAEAESKDSDRLAMYARLGAELDAFDERIAATAGAAAEAELERQRVEAERAAELEQRSREEAARLEAERIAKLSEKELEREANAAAELEREAAAAAEREAEAERNRAEREARRASGELTADELAQGL
jgi:hypothetical protein